MGHRGQVTLSWGFGLGTVSAAHLHEPQRIVCSNGGLLVELSGVRQDFAGPLASIACLNTSAMASGQVRFCAADRLRGKEKPFQRSPLKWGFVETVGGLKCLI